MTVNPQKLRACIITTVHEPRDDRIFHKQALSLVRAGFEVSLIARWREGMDSGLVRKLPLPQFGGKLDRLVRGSWCSLRLALRERAAVYHFHDPELLPLGVMLKLCGKRVIYDAHEDYSRKVLSRPLPQWLRVAASKFLRVFEAACAMFFDRVITADGHVAGLFPASKTTVVANYPPLTFVQPAEVVPRSATSPLRLVYVGGISYTRGIGKIIEAINSLRDRPLEFHLAGNVAEDDLLALLKSHPRVTYHGVLPWEQVSRLLATADVGMLVLQPIPAFEYCPGENIIKLWEYLGMGLPVIISNFPKLKQLIENLDAGIAVDPTSPQAIVDAIRRLDADRALCRRFGQNGRAAVLRDRNWESQAMKLVEIYRGLLGN